MFGECILELTNLYSIPSHRHRSLSTTAKARELMRSIRDVGKRMLPKPSLRPMIEEFEESVDADPIVRSILERNHIPRAALNISETDSLEKMIASVEIYLDLVAPAYASEAEDLIVKLCDSTKIQKSQLRTIADLYVSHLVGVSLSRETLHIIAKREFGICQVDDPMLALKEFFRALSTRSSHYDILVSASEEVCGYLATSLRPEVYKKRNDLPDRFRLACFGRNGSSSDGPFILLRDLPGADAFLAVRNAKYLLEVLHSFLFVFPDGTRWINPEFCYVYDSREGAVFKASMVDFINEGGLIRSKKAHSELIQKMAVFAFDRSDALSRRSGVKLASALLAASAASRVVENDARLLSIWSAFEGILPYPLKDGEGTVRINHFANYITPLATDRYIESLFKSFMNDLARNYMKKFLSFIDRNGVGNNRFEKFVSVFYLEDAIKAAFTSIFSDSEILLYRAHELDGIANDSSKLKAKVLAHERRVAWQLHRIYRARNMIIHSARSAPYFPQLTENAFGYFKAMTTILVEAGGKFRVSNSDALFDLCLALCERKRVEINEAGKKNAREALLASLKSLV
jgi:hypothetical protein